MYDSTTQNNWKICCLCGLANFELADFQHMKNSLWWRLKICTSCQQEFKKYCFKYTICKTLVKVCSANYSAIEEIFGQYIGLTTISYCIKHNIVWNVTNDVEHICHSNNLYFSLSFFFPLHVNSSWMWTFTKYEYLLKSRVDFHPSVKYSLAWIRRYIILWNVEVLSPN